MILPEHKEPEQHPDQDHNQEEGGQEKPDHLEASPQGTRIFVSCQYMREEITHRAGLKTQVRPKSRSNTRGRGFVEDPPQHFSVVAFILR